MIGGKGLDIFNFAENGVFMHERTDNIPILVIQTCARSALLER